MNRIIIIFLCCYCLSVVTLPAQIAKDTYHDTVIIDEYRWLEDLDSEATKEWMKLQTKKSKKYLSLMRSKYKGYDSINKYSYSKSKYFHKEGAHYYSKWYYELERPPGLYIQRKVDGESKPFILPTEISTMDWIELMGYRESQDGKYLAFSFSRNASDDHEIKVKSIRGVYLKDHLKYAFAPRWSGDGFFYYYAPPQTAIEKNSPTNRIVNTKEIIRPKTALEKGSGSNPRLMYHRLKTKQEEDELIYYRKSKQEFDLDFEVLNSGEYLVIYEKDILKGTHNIFIKDLVKPNGKIQPLFIRNNYRINILHNIGDTLIAITDYQSDRKTIVKFHKAQPNKLIQLIPTYEDAILTNAKIVGNKLLCRYSLSTKRLFQFYDFDGTSLHTMEFESGYTVGGFSGQSSDGEELFYYTSYFVPRIVHRMNMEDFSTKLVSKTKAAVDITKYEIKSVKYPSKDSTMIPMNIVYKKGLKLDGRNPTLVKTYGGYGKDESPSYDEGLVYFMENGGVYAYCYVRGGGIYGKKWELAGKRLKRQNSIDDLIAGCEYLIKENYTQSKHLGITGGSHGGLLVGAAMTQRPDLFKAVVPVVGVFDMLRSEKSTSMAFHEAEYGLVKNEKDFRNLLSYSPLHNIKKGVNYPATLLVTGENDDRVPPYHTYKFAEKLQRNPGQTNPIIVRIEEKVGHYGANDVESNIYEKADIYAFLLYHLKGEYE